MRHEDWVFAMNQIEAEARWLRSIMYPVTKPQLKFREFVIEHLDAYSIAQ